MDVLHELLEVEDVVERPAHGGAGERVLHRVERAVQDDPVHLIILFTIMIGTWWWQGPYCFNSDNDQVITKRTQWSSCSQIMTMAMTNTR